MRTQLGIAAPWTDLRKRTTYSEEVKTGKSYHRYGGERV